MYRIGVDLGGTNIATGVLNEKNEIVGRGKVKTRAPRPAPEIFDSIKESVEMAIADAGISIQHGHVSEKQAGNRRGQRQL